MADPDVERATACLLWAAARPDPDVEEVAAAVRDGADVVAAADAAMVGRVGPLVWRALRAAGVDDHAGEAGDLLSRESDLRRVQAALLIPEALEAILPPLSAAGLEPLVFKGPAIAERYPEPGLRAMDDIDVVLPERQLQAALRALHDVGWKEIHGRHGDHYDRYLVHPRVPGLPVELHWDLATWRTRSDHLRGTGLWRRRVPTTCFGLPAFGLRPEVELVALAAHAGKPFHHFQRLIWSVDIAVLLAAAPSLDWDRVAHDARRAGCRTAVAVVLRHARRLGAAVPDDLELLHVTGRGLRSEALEPVLADTWPLRGTDEGGNWRLRYAVADSPRRRAMLLLSDTFSVPASEIPGNVVRVGVKAVARWRAVRSHAP